jgi:nucleoside-diphosphate-sugar epimerase
VSSLVTGFPALRARRIVAEIAARAASEPLVALVHPSRTAEARAAADELGLLGRLEIIAADPAAIDFGLPGAEYRALAARIRHVHAAYSIVDPDVNGALLEATNVGAARELVEFARAARRLERVVLYSSVFVSGDRRGPVAETELESGQAFRNPAERTLAVAERMLKRSGAPITILRAGHLLDDKMAGLDRPSGPYLCVALCLSTAADTPIPLPPFAEAPLPITPADFLARLGAVAPSRLPEGRTLHAIDPRPITLRGFVEQLADLLGRRLEPGFKAGALTRALLGNPSARLLPKNRRGLLEVLTTGGAYETVGVSELMAAGGPACPPLSEYLKAIVDHLRERIEQGPLDARGREEAPYLVA